MMRLIPTLYACLLRLYPAVFRERFGEEMQYVFDQAWAAAWQRGTLSAIGFCLRECLGLLVGILRSHWAASRGKVFSRLVFNPRLALPILAVIAATMAAALSLQYWGYLVTPPSPGPLLSALHTVDSIHFVQFDADYRAQVIPLAQFPQTATADYPPSQILPLLTDYLGEAASTAPLDTRLTGQLAAVLREQQLTLRTPPWAGYDSQPRYCLARSDTCFTDSALLPPGQPYAFQPGIRFQPDGHIVRIWPVFKDEAGDAMPTGETEEHLITPASGWFYYSHFLPGGFVVQGRDASGAALTFVNVASSSLSGGDRYRYAAFLLADGENGLSIRGETLYGFDVAGLEGITFPVLTLVLIVPVVLAWLLLMLLWRIYRLLAHLRAARRSYG